MHPTRSARRPERTRLRLVLAGVALLCAAAPAAADTWRGLTVAPEDRCSPYNRDDYPYSQSIERVIVERLGGRIYGPYTGRHFTSAKATDIEHIVAVSEAHDSGLCGADRATRARFSQDLLNLTLAAPEINRCDAGGKCAFDAAQWLPDRNRCWFAARVVAVRKKYGLTIDPREAAALDHVLSGCASTKMVLYRQPTTTASPAASIPTTRATTAATDALGRWDDNRNGRITCAEARRHGIAPVKRGHPAYPYMRDGDGDGVVCE